MASSLQQLKPDITTTTSEGSSLPIPVWTEEEHHLIPAAAGASKQQQPLVSDDGLHVVVRKPVAAPVHVDGLHVVSHESATAEEAPPPPYETGHRCAVLPSRAAEWRVRGADSDDDVRLSTLAAAILVREGVLDGENVELIPHHHEQKEGGRGGGEGEEGVDDDGEKRTRRRRGRGRGGGRDARAAGASVDPTISTFRSICDVQRRASEAEMRSYRRKMLAAAAAEAGRRRSEEIDQQQHQRQQSGTGTSSSSSSSPVAGGGTITAVDRASSSVPSRSTSSVAAESSSRSGTRESADVRVARKPSNGAEKLDRWAEGVAHSGKNVARIVGTGLSAPGLYTHEIARGIHNLPRRYGDETVRRDDRIVGFTSGLAAAGKGFGYGLYDGITGIFVQPVTGAQKEGAKGFVKGCVKGVTGAVTKPAAGSFGLAGHTLVGISRSIEKSISRKPREEECIAVASVSQGEEELRSLTDQEKKAIMDAWFAGSR